MKPRSRRQNSAAPVLLANQERLSRILLGLALLSGVAFMAPVLRAGPLALDEARTPPASPSRLRAEGISALLGRPGVGRFKSPV